MMTWSRQHILAAGVGLILLSNAVALGGVAYNRSGQPERTLSLTERELQRAYDWSDNRENSGMALTLRWRILAEATPNARDDFTTCPSYTETPAWLQQGKLAALGFDTSPRTTAPPRLRLAPAREVLLVLELSGTRYQLALQRARDCVAKAQDLSAANGNTKLYEEKLRAAKAKLDREENLDTRLFVIDAGLDFAALRAQYLDPTRYAIVRGRIRPEWTASISEPPRLIGYVSGVSVDHINVPHAFRVLPLFQSSPGGSYYSLPAVTIRVAYGRRLEPWIAAVAKR